jgi:hypothetical protein
MRTIDKATLTDRAETFGSFLPGFAHHLQPMGSRSRRRSSILACKMGSLLEGVANANCKVEAIDQAAQGVVLISDVRQATAANYRAKADLLQASLGYLLARAELERTVGRTPGLGTP